MEQMRVERLDHLGLIASVIKDLGLIDMIDRRLVPDEQESEVVLALQPLLRDSADGVRQAAVETLSKLFLSQQTAISCELSRKNENGVTLVG